jgi:murein L,D-transpeptidase YafK
LTFRVGILKLLSMQQRRLASFTLIVFLTSISWASAAEKKNTTALLVDKKLNQLHVTEYVSGEYKVLKTYHATMGKVVGDKIDEGDLKTPEGIYTFKALLTPPSLKKKFGAMAFYINYPNTFDQLAGMTGFDIMLHATDTPERLAKNFDSEGCVVVKDEEIREIKPFIRLGLTPIVIFPELTPEYMKPGQDSKLVGFFNSWVKAWETESVDAYIDHYHSDFSAQGMDKPAWKKFKTNLASRYSTISIGPEDVMVYRHPKYSMVTFTQNYTSKLNSGAWGHRSRGTKILYIAEEAGQPKIIAESYTTLMW